MLTQSDLTVSFRGAGLFQTGSAWTHPIRIESTYELIFMVCGTAYIESGGVRRALTKGCLLVLPPHEEHCGYAQSIGATSFYWVHFSPQNKTGRIPLPEFVPDFSAAHLFKELLHYSQLPNCPPYMATSVLTHLLAEIAFASLSQNIPLSKTASEVYEWARINADARLTVQKTAAHFGYNPEHLSRLIRKTYGVGLKPLLTSFTLQRAKELLCNTNYFVKEIAAQLSFPDTVSFVNFYQYHEKTTPTAYRSRYAKTHMNKR